MGKEGMLGNREKQLTASYGMQEVEKLGNETGTNR